MQWWPNNLPHPLSLSYYTGSRGRVLQVGPLHECGGVLICCRVVNVWIWRRVVDVWHGEWQLMWEDINTSDGGGSWIIQL